MTAVEKDLAYIILRQRQRRSDGVNTPDSTLESTAPIDARATIWRELGVLKLTSIMVQADENLAQDALRGKNASAV